VTSASQAEGYLALKRAAEVMPSNIDKHSVEGEESVRLCNYVDVYKNDRINGDMEFMAATATAAQIERFTLRTGDVIVTKDSEEPTDIGIPAYVPEDMPGVVCGYHLAVLRPDPQRLHGGFLAWWLRSKEVHAYYSTAATGISRYALSVNDIGMTPLRLPPFSQQERIAKFLDEQTARIDALITEKGRLLKNLTEFRKSIISEVTLRGLQKDVSTRSSGYDWLGETPAHWQLKKMKHLGEAVIGLTYSPDDVTDADNGVLVLRSSNIRDGQLAFDDNVYVTCAIPGKLRVQAGDILICSRNGSRTLIGKNAFIEPEHAGLTFGAFMTVFRSPHNAYIRWVLNSPLFDFHSASFLTSTINQLTTGSLNSFVVPFPPKKERQEIATYLSARTAEVDLLIRHVNQHIERLREYRSSLISAAVTGQLDISTFTENLPRVSS